MTAPIDRMLGWFGVYRSVDRAYDQMEERILSRLAPATPTSFPNVYNQLAKLDEAFKLPHYNVVHVKYSGAYTFVTGHTLYIDQSLESKSDTAVLFALAHELGHIACDHSVAIIQLSKVHAPGWVTVGKLNQLNSRLSDEKATLSHRQEYEADKVATIAMHQLGFDLEDVCDAFAEFGLDSASATHPSAQSRLLEIRNTYASLAR